MRASLTAAFLLLASFSLHAKTLHWRAIDVDAQLDRHGVLTVSETQTFVFDGDWNGGERRFDVRPMQQLELLGIERVDGTNAIPLQPGDLDAVDHYAMMDGSVLRWRSRLPSDPPFANQELTYRIRYRLSGILRGREGAYRLDHDFLFPDRAGVVERFALRLAIDPVWGIGSSITGSAENIEPGRGYVVTRELTWRGEAQPAGAVTLPPPGPGRLMAALLGAGIVALFANFFWQERKSGRFGKLTPVGEIDERWMRENVFDVLSPEAAGAAWDEHIGAPEVAAALASLAQERKISTSVEKKRWRGDVLKMRLLVDRNEISGYQRTLVNKLFFNQRRETDTDEVRKHYSSTGLDLAKIITPSIEGELGRLAQWNAKRKFPWVTAVVPLLATVAALFVVAFRGGNDQALVLGCFFYGFLALTFSLIFAAVHSNAMSWLVPRFGLVFLFCVPLVWTRIHYFNASSEIGFSMSAMIAAAAFTLATIHLVLAALRSRESREKMEYRRTLISARRYLQAQLRSANPRLSDDWFAYILAFGLGRNVDRWFRKHSVSDGRSSSSASSSFGSSSSSMSGSSWTGGGGAFGGAGASGAWAVAAAGIGAGVATPGSSGSGSGGGGGGGGSSSGGGGGGGW